MAEADAEYTVYVSDTTRFPEDMVMALTYKMAFLTAATLTRGDKSFKIADRMGQFYELWISKAKAQAANEQQTATAPDAEWIEGRT